MKELLADKRTDAHSRQNSGSSFWSRRSSQEGSSESGGGSSASESSAASSVSLRRLLTELQSITTPGGSAPPSSAGDGSHCQHSASLPASQQGSGPGPEGTSRQMALSLWEPPLVRGSTALPQPGGGSAGRPFPQRRSEPNLKRLSAQLPRVVSGTMSVNLAPALYSGPHKQRFSAPHALAAKRVSLAMEVTPTAADLDTAEAAEAEAAAPPPPPPQLAHRQRSRSVGFFAAPGLGPNPPNGFPIPISSPHRSSSSAGTASTARPGLEAGRVRARRHECATIVFWCALARSGGASRGCSPGLPSSLAACGAAALSARPRARPRPRRPRSDVVGYTAMSAALHPLEARLHCLRTRLRVQNPVKSSVGSLV